MAQRTPALTLLDKVFVGILLVIFGGIVLHAPLSVGFGVLFPDFPDVIKAWKEVLLVIASLCLLAILFLRKQWARLRSPLMYVIAGYAALHVALLPVFPQGPAAAVAGLAIDLRYLLFFVLVYAAIRLYPSLRRSFIVTFFAGAFLVAAFALLQVFFLPNDFLKYLGYGPSTISPFLTVDDNSDFIRISSTLRGPNPLGAYAGIVIAAVAALWLKAAPSRLRNQKLAISVIVIGSAVALWASYSRSALFAAFVALAIIILVVIGAKISRRLWIALMIIGVVALSGLYVARDTYLVSNVLLHQNATTGADIDSNEAHADSLQDGVERMIRQPLGGGIGSTGSASLYGQNGLIIENQYLFIAHETGWLGLAGFLAISYMVLRGLWRKRTDWLALSVFASGIGLALIGLLLPVWVDDTVAIIWWGLAAAALAAKGGVYVRRTNK
jgi:hypothetical protein